MISCDDCQKKLVATLDSEGAEDDEKLISIHLKDCPQCRAFQEDIVKLRQRFVSVAVPGLPAVVGQELMRIAQDDSLRSNRRGHDKNRSRQPLLLRFPRLAWAGGLAALFLIGMSWVVSFNLAQEVKVLRQELETSRRELALAREKEQIEEAQDRQQKAISALYFRMQELEQRIDRSATLRAALVPAERNGL
jgi:anti-sigma factor RsiW